MVWPETDERAAAPENLWLRSWLSFFMAAVGGWVGRAHGSLLHQATVLPAAPWTPVAGWAIAPFTASTPDGGGGLGGGGLEAWAAGPDDHDSLAFLQQKRLPLKGWVCTMAPTWLFLGVVRWGARRLMHASIWLPSGSQQDWPTMGFLCACLCSLR